MCNKIPPFVSECAHALHMQHTCRTSAVWHEQVLPICVKYVHTYMHIQLHICIHAYICMQVSKTVKGDISSPAAEQCRLYLGELKLFFYNPILNSLKGNSDRSTLLYNNNILNQFYIVFRFRIVRIIPVSCGFVSLSITHHTKGYFSFCHHLQHLDDGDLFIFDDSFEHEVWHNGT